MKIKYLLIVICFSLLTLGGGIAIVCTSSTNFPIDTMAVDAVITLNKQGGTGGTDYVTGYYGRTLESITPPTKSHYAFSGYYSSTSGSGLQYYNSSGTGLRAWGSSTISTYTLYAKWSKFITLYKYDGTTSVIEFVYGNGYPEFAVPTRDGYQFLGYYDKSSGDQCVNTEGKCVNTGYYATGDEWEERWARITTISFNRQSGTGGTKSVTVVYGHSMPTITIPTRTGYTFKGYYSSINGGGTKYYSNNGYSAHSWDRDVSTATLYAYWTPIIYKVTLVSNGGTGGTEEYYYKHNYSTYYSDEECTKVLSSITCPTSDDGSRFAGYFPPSDGGIAQGGGTQYVTKDGEHVNDIYLHCKDETLYARWVYTITLAKLGGEGGPDCYYYIKYQWLDAFAEYEWDVYYSDFECLNILTEIEVPTTNTGAYFAGYFLRDPGSDIAGGGTQFVTKDGEHVNDIYLRCENETLYARWVYEITLDKQGGYSGTDFYYYIEYEWGVYYSEFECMTELPEVEIPTHPGGGDFIGYFYDDGVNVIKYVSDQGKHVNYLYDTYEHRVLYAIWEFTITLDKQGGYGGTDCYFYKGPGYDVYYIDYECEYELYSVVIPIRDDGAAFAGYFTEPLGQGTQYVTCEGEHINNLYQNCEDDILYAFWIYDDDDFIFKVNLIDNTGGTLHTTEYYYKYQEDTYYVDESADEKLSSVEIPTRTEDFKFKGFFLEEFGQGTQYVDVNGGHVNRICDVWSDTGEIDIYAAWTGKLTLDNSLEGDLSAYEEIEVYIGDFYPSSVDTPYLDGYDFGGYWFYENGQTSSNDQYYDARGKILDYEWRFWDNITLQAVWFANVDFIDTVYGTNGDLIETVNPNIRVGYSGSYMQPNETNSTVTVNMPTASATTITLESIYSNRSSSYTVTVRLISGAITQSASASSHGYLKLSHSRTTQEESVSLSELAAGKKVSLTISTGSLYTNIVVKIVNTSSAASAFNSARLAIKLENSGSSTEFSPQTAIATMSGLPDRSRIVNVLQGYIFRGYYTEERGQGELVYNYDMSRVSGYSYYSSINPIRFHTLYAHWEETWASVENIEVPEGAGTQASPYLIKSPGNLGWIAYQGSYENTFKGKYFKQIENIDLDGNIWLPINIYDNYGFQGVYDGNNKVTSYMIIPTYMPVDYYGMFGYVTDGVLTNIVLNESDIQSYNKYSGALAGYIYQNCSIQKCVMLNVNMSARYGSAGGLIGAVLAYNTDTFIENCQIIGTITSYLGAVTGGVIGQVDYVYSLELTNIYVDVDFSVVANTINGGLIGMADGTIALSHCMYKGAISGSGTKGFVARNEGELYLDSCRMECQRVNLSWSGSGSGSLVINDAILEDNNGTETVTGTISSTNWISINGKRIPKGVVWMGASV